MLKSYFFIPLRYGVCVGTIYGLISSFRCLYNINKEAIYNPDIFYERIYYFRLPSTMFIWDATEVYRILVYTLSLLGCYYESYRLIQLFVYLRASFLPYSVYALYHVVRYVYYDAIQSNGTGNFIPRPITIRVFIAFSLFTITTTSFLAAFLGIQVYDLFVAIHYKKSLVERSVHQNFHY
ncbi:MAG: hypothetical protein EXX96DRAFT_566119, partial [Benjaminiella poitrasii]